MDHSKIYAYLRDATGIDVVSIGEEAVDRVVKGRMKEGGFETVEEYLSCLDKSIKERQIFINDITVPETWFFRDKEPFKLLSQYVSKTWKSSGDKFRVLSIPCSTGEEPYSISMVLMDAGLSPDSFVVDAVDINTRVLEVAKKGVYGKNSFRSDDLKFRDKYFNCVGSGHEIKDEVKSSVNFHHNNILSSDFLKDRNSYDVIFCRNLLIYFNIETKEKVIKSLRRIIVSDGILFLGHAETGRVVNGLFDSMRHSGAFAYRPTILEKDAPIKVNVSPVIFSYKDPERNEKSSDLEIIREVEPKTNFKNEGSGFFIEDIQALADRGELDKAMKLCCDYIEKNPLEADAHCLQGIIYLAKSNNDNAQVSFKRSIYIDPGHYQSLTHLLILAVERGDSQAAMNYRARIGRAKERS